MIPIRWANYYGKNTSINPPRDRWIYSKTMLGLEFSTGYLFDLKKSYFLKWNFLGVSAALSPIQISDHMAIKLMLPTGLKFGKNINRHFGIYGLIDPVDFTFFQIIQQSTFALSLGATLGGGIQWNLSSCIGLFTEMSWTHAYFNLKGRTSFLALKTPDNIPKTNLPLSFNHKQNTFKVLLGVEIRK